MAEWMRSSRCGNGGCAEVLPVEGGVMFRSSDHPEVELFFTAEEWAELLAGVRAGEFDS